MMPFDQDDDPPSKWAGTAVALVLILAAALVVAFLAWAAHHAVAGAPDDTIPETTWTTIVMPPAIPVTTLAIVEPAVAQAVAMRITLPDQTVVATTSTVPSDPCALVLYYLVEHAPTPTWDVGRMMRYARRESGPNCQADAYNRGGQATGVLQVTPINYPYLSDVLGEHVDRTWLTNVENNVRAAAALCEYGRRAGWGCYYPWAT